ncbi:MAG: flavodoxin family protein [Parabacteroides sp.]|nr:flavodoxin family protein [Parabacteroides sp.]
MKVTVLNGSPRKGNTSKALDIFQESLNASYEVERFDLYESSIKACRNCNGCKPDENGCVHHDGANKILQELISSDIIVFGTPVYYWGISAQMKLLIDKFYSVNSRLTAKKKVVAVAVGANTVDDIQYELIGNQLKSISNYLQWDFVSFIPVSAYNPDDICGQEDKIAEIRSVAASL